MAPNHRALGVPLGHMAESSWKPQGEQRPDIRWLVGREMSPWSYLILWKWILIPFNIFNTIDFSQTQAFHHPKILPVHYTSCFPSTRHPRKLIFQWENFGPSSWQTQLLMLSMLSQSQHVLTLSSTWRFNMARNGKGGCVQPLRCRRCLFPPRRKRPPPAQQMEIAITEVQGRSQWVLAMTDIKLCFFLVGCDMGMNILPCHPCLSISLHDFTCLVQSHLWGHLDAVPVANAAKADAWRGAAQSSHHPPSGRASHSDQRCTWRFNIR